MDIMSEFASKGFPEYPNLHLDREAVSKATDWSDNHLNDKIAQYREFTRRERILPRHMERAKEISKYLEFEGDARDGLFDFLGEITTADINKLKDETRECF